MNLIQSFNLFSKDQRESFAFFLVAYFFALFNYPLIRAATTAQFIEDFGAKSSPQAWLFTVFFLSLAVGLSNFLQARLSVQKVFFIISTVSAGIFCCTDLLAKLPFIGYLPFIWKDIYIVLQIHLLLAFANQALSKKIFKRWVGPIGAIGSLGGIFGGLLTSYLSSETNTSVVIMVGSIIVWLPGLFFLKTTNAFSEQESNDEHKSKSPMQSFTPEVKKYVFYIALVVALTQFVINLADFQFNISFEQSVAGRELRTGYLGHLYSATNFLTLLFQFFLVPRILSKVEEKNFHLFIPVSYLFGQMIFMWGMAGSFWAMATFYIYLKASDYSFFSSAKELLYQPLTPSQKYGAKYITDMLVYRYSKAAIAVILIYFQSILLINMLMVIFIGLWLFSIIQLFRHYPKSSSS